jgi:UDP-N-acetylmuramoyl-tripeptide--D-alanyl-D-alanine ligase
MKLDIRFLCKAVQGSIINGDPNISFSGVSTDSRSVLPGQVFFALEGKKHDGHQYVNQAFSRGAAAAVVSKVGNEYKEQPLILVSDTIHALQQLAKDYRSLFNIPLTAVTGSVGKTTTKEILAQCLESTYVTLKTQEVSTMKSVFP